MSLGINSYSYEARETSRTNIKRVKDILTRIEGVAAGRYQQTPDFVSAVTHLTGTSDLEKQHQAMTAMLATMERSHYDRLVLAAPNDLTAFAEVMAPHEPPAPHHIFLAEHLMYAEDTPNSRVGISMPPGHAKDLDVETPVMMGDGTWRRLGDVRVGETVISHLGRAQEVLAVHDQGVRPVLKIVTETGRVIRAHPEHVFLTPQDWMAAEDLQPGMNLALPKVFITDDLCEYSNDEFAFAGYMMARAFVTGRAYNRLHRITTKFRCDDPAILSDIKALAIRLGFISKQRREQLYGKEAVLVSFDEACKDWLLDAGLYGMKKTEMRIPEWVFTGNDTQISHFLGAIFSCDATFVPDLNKHTGRHKQMMLTFKDNVPLARDLHRLLLRFGVKANFVVARSTNYNYDHAVFGKVVITDTLSMVTLGKRLRLTGSNAKRWALPMVVEGFGSDHYHNDRIVSITDDGECETRCLTVEEDHSFLAEGIAVHNSTYSSRYYPAWYLGRKERRKYLQAGHTQSFVEQEFGKKTRDLIDSQPYRDVFPGVFLRHDSKAAGNWKLTNGNEYVVKGVGQGISGVRSTCNGVDDPYKTYQDAQSPTTRLKTWDWYANDFMTRLLPGGPAIIVMTRWHIADIIGEIEEKIRNGDISIDWKIVNLPAFCLDETTDQMSRKVNEPLWKEFYTSEMLNSIRENMSTAQWACLYEGNPIPSEGNIIKKEWIVRSDNYPTVRMGTRAISARDPMISVTGPEILDRDPANSGQAGTIPYKRTVVSVDSAETENARSDFSAITVWRETPNGYHYLVDAFRDRMEFTKLITAVEDMAQRWDADFILMENKGAGNQYIQARGDTGLAPCPVVKCDPTRKGDKVFRMDGVSVMFQQKRVVFPLKAAGNWLSELERELLQFPGSKNDDFADSISQYLAWFRDNQRMRRGAKSMR